LVGAIAGNIVSRAAIRDRGVPSKSGNREIDRAEIEVSEPGVYRRVHDFHWRRHGRSGPGDHPQGMMIFSGRLMRTTQNRLMATLPSNGMYSLKKNSLKTMAWRSPRVGRQVRPNPRIGGHRGDGRVRRRGRLVVLASICRISACPAAIFFREPPTPSSPLQARSDRDKHRIADPLSFTGDGDTQKFVRKAVRCGVLNIEVKPRRKTKFVKIGICRCQ